MSLYRIKNNQNLDEGAKTVIHNFMKRLVNIKFEEEQKGNKTNINMYNGSTYLGTVDLYKYLSDNLTWVGNLEIEPQFRGQGLGRTLFDYCLKKEQMLCA